MKLLFILLQVVFIGNYHADTVPKKGIQFQTTQEINQIFDQANSQLKSDEVLSLLTDMEKQLNGSMIYGKGDSIIYEKWTGYKKLSKVGNRNEMITKESLFNLASLSKQFTATAILLLASQDKLDLDDPITKYLPSLPYSQVTIKNLLTHTSGIPEYLDYEKYFNKNTSYTNQMIINYFAARVPASKVVPNREFKYINTNYVFLASIVEKVTGEKFEDYSRKNLFIPAGMTNTFFYTELSDIPNIDLCEGHLRNKSQVSDNILNSVVGDKSLYSTAEDLFKWYKAFFIEYKILPKEWVELAITPQNYIKGKLPNELYGYGFRIENNPKAGTLVYHGGLWKGFHHVMTFRPKDQLFILFLSNYRNRVHNGKTNEILEILEGV